MSADEKLEQVIIAEDSAPNRKILGHLLKKLGYDVITCENGEEAWAALTADKDKRIVAILTDVMMPLMDGLTLLKKVRANPEYEKVPVVLVTAVSDKNLVTEAVALKVDGYILKPVTFQRVETKMKELFPNKNFPKLTA